MNESLALKIIEFIDKFHQPHIWTLGGVIAVLALVESFLNENYIYKSFLGILLIYFKLFFLVMFDLVFFTQGLFGGCLLQVPQNYLARKYLGMDFWYPFGIVYRESLNPVFWPYLRIFYLFLGIFAIYRTRIYIQKFIINSMTRK